MDLEKVFISDIETNGYLHDVTKLHVLGCCYKNSKGQWDIKTTAKKEDVIKLFCNPNNTIVGHNFWLYDVPVIEKLYNVKVTATIIDTLWLAWYIDFDRIKKGKRFGLASYGEDYGVPKPEIESWTDLSFEEYKNRVVEDAKINTNLWVDLLKKYRILYDNDDELIKKQIRFLMSMARLCYTQQNNPLKLDIENVKKEMEDLLSLQNGKVKILKTVMPKIVKKVKRNPPSKPYKKDGSLSAIGIKWKRLTEGCGLPFDYNGSIEEVVGYEDPNPQSVKQVKDWLFSLKWKPLIYKESKTVSGDTNRVPQTLDKNKNLCSSVKKLIDKEPVIQELDDLGVIGHRIGILKGFLRDQNKERIVAGVAGVTNTLRLRHKYLVNLPKPSAPYANGIRASLIADEGCVLVGSDLSSLESVTRNAFIKPYDPEYVYTMENDKYYDAHLDIALFANLMEEKDVLFYKYWKAYNKDNSVTWDVFGHNTDGFEDFFNSIENKDEYFNKLDKARSASKTVNYSAMYGIGAAKLSKELKITKQEAQNLLDAFWERNKAIKQFSDDQETKSALGSLWVKNPLNGFFYSLRGERDIFSTVNQGSGAYIHQLICEGLLRQGIKIQGSFHDEWLGNVKKGDEEGIIKIMKDNAKRVKSWLPIDVAVDIDYKFGDSYAKIH